MGWVSGIVVFLLVWWTALFVVLPWGMTRDVDGTPRSLNLKKKFLITTAVSILLWVMIYALIAAEVISFREMAKSIDVESSHEKED